MSGDAWRLLEGIPAVYLDGEAYTVAVMDLAADAAAIGGRSEGRAYWTGEGWRFDVDPRAGYPLVSLLHEVAHVVLGHTSKRKPVVGPPPRLVAADRERIVSDVVQRRECEADAWAEREARRWERAWFRAGGGE